MCFILACVVYSLNCCVLYSTSRQKERGFFKFLLQPVYAVFEYHCPGKSLRMDSATHVSTFPQMLWDQVSFMNLYIFVTNRPFYTPCKTIHVHLSFLKLELCTSESTHTLTSFFQTCVQKAAHPSFKHIFYMKWRPTWIQPYIYPDECTT